MKYARLTREQLHEMHHEFIRFLASQGIDAEEWEQIKTEQPKTAEEEIDVFSDVVWERVLNKVEYLEHFSKQQLFLFKVEKHQLSLIGVRVENNAIDLHTKAGYRWLQNNLTDEQVSLYTSTKAIAEERNTDIFALIQQGANITKGELYTYFENIVKPN